VIVKRILLYLFYVVLVAIFILFLYCLGLNIYLHSHLEKVIDDIPVAENAELRFNESEVNLFKSFPDVHIVLRDLVVTNKDKSPSDLKELTANKLSIDISVGLWKERQISIQAISIDSAAIRYVIDGRGVSNLSKLLSDNISPNNESEKTNKVDSDSWNIDHRDLRINVTNSDFIYYDSLRNTDVETYVRNLSVRAKQTSEGYVSSVQLNILVNQFVLNENNGSFIQGAELNGDFNCVVVGSRIIIEPFDLIIDEHSFKFDADISTTDEKTVLHFINERTNYKDVVELLTPKLRETLAPYNISKEFKTNTRLDITPGLPIRVDIDFELSKNDVYINKMIYTDTSLKGKFANRKYTHKVESDTLKSHIRFDLENVSTKFDEMDITMPYAIISSNPNRKDRIKGMANITGDAEKIAEQLKNNHFEFNEGQFVMDANVDASFRNLQSLVTGSDIKLSVMNTEVNYLPSDVAFPLQRIELQKESNSGLFSVVGATLDNRYDLKLNGQIDNLTGMLFDLSNSRASSSVNLSAKRMSWEDFIDIFGGDSSGSAIKKTVEQKRKSLKQTLKGIQHHFGPTIKIKIDSSGYYNKLSVENIIANLVYIDDHTLSITDSSFEMCSGKVFVDCEVEIESDILTPFDLHLRAEHINLNNFLPPLGYFKVQELKDLEYLPRDFDVDIKLKGIINDSTGVITESLQGDITFSSSVQRIEHARIIFDYGDRVITSTGDFAYPLNTKMELRGNPYVFNEFFQNDKFFFSDGKFTLAMDYTGENLDLANIISEANIKLRIDNSQVLYGPLDVVFPLTNIDLDIKNDSSAYSVLIRSKSLGQEISMDGQIMNTSELIVGNTGKPIKTITDVYSPRISWDNLVDIFQIESENQIATKKPIEKDKSFRKNIIDILYSFHPEMVIAIDTIEYSDSLSLYKFASEMRLRDSNYLDIKNLDFIYKGSSVGLEAGVELFEDDIGNMDLHLKAEQIDLGLLVSDIKEEFGISNMHLHQMTGILDFDLTLIGSLSDDQNSILQDTTIGKLDFALYDMRIRDSEWLQKLGRKAYISDRFQDVRFSTIKNSLSIQGDQIMIPLMELQSNAINFFVEGHYHQEDPNLWLSFPVHNIKSKDLSLSPEKEGYARRKAKLHLEYANDESGESKFKLRLNKRKFYKDRGILDQYRRDKKRYRDDRKQQREDRKPKVKN